MSARTIDGNALAAQRRQALATRVTALAATGLRPCLAALSIGADPAWGVYQRNQQRSCGEVGLEYRSQRLDADADDGEVAEAIEALNNDPSVHGIILQSPLPRGLNTLAAQALISPEKDVEAVNPANLGLVLAGRAHQVPCTARAAVDLAVADLGDLRGLEAVVVGSSVIVGRPIGQLLLGLGATVSTCHIDTRDLAAHSTRADLLIVAVGKAGLITPALVKPGATVIDVGINRVPGPDGKLRTVGDVDPAVAEVAGALTPVPGGVGPVTATVLLEATVAAAERLRQQTPALSPGAVLRLLGESGAELSPAAAKRVADLLGQHLPRLAEGGAWRSPFERHLGRRVLVLDGAMGTALLAAGMAPEALDRAAITQPTAVLAVHRAMRAAGAEALTAHTFRCNRFALGSVAAAVETAAAGVRLARQAAGGQAFVLGSIGPLGPVVGADLDAQTAADAAGEVAIAMADAGADAIVLETLPSTREANALLRGVRAACDLPVIVCRSFTRDDAAEITAFAVAMEAGGAAAIGANCGNGPAGLHAVLRRLLAATRLPVLARPHAGFPELTDSSARYRLEPAWFARQAEQYCLAGAAAVGGCCGVSHEHIAALAGLAGRPVLRQEGLPLLLTPAPAAVPMPVLPAPFNALGRDFATVALLGGPGGTPSPAAAQALAAAGVHAVGHLAGTASDVPARLPARLRALADACGRPAVLDLPAQAIDREQAQNALLTAHLLGLRLVLIDGGIFSGLGGRSPRPAGVEGLLRLITDLNAGVDRAGVRLEQPTAFGVGVRLRAEDLADTARYAALGARFVAVAPVYEPERWRSALAAADNALPILAEVLVLPDAATAEALANEMPGIEVPPHVRQRLVEEPDQDLRGVLAFLHHWRHRLAGVVLLVPNDETRPAVAVLAGIRSH